MTWKVSNKKGATAAAKYEVTPYRGTTAESPVTVDAPATTATVTGLHNNATYTFKVLAVDAEGHKSKESLPSKAVTPKASASSAWYKRKRYWAIAFVVLAALDRTRHLLLPSQRQEDRRVALQPTTCSGTANLAVALPRAWLEPS